jgi:hypothetical protein
MAAAFGCSEADAGRTSTNDAIVATTASPLDPGLARERLDKLRAAPVRQQVSEVDRTAARSHRRALHAPAALLAKLDATPVPALVPDDPTLLEVAKATSGPHWYAVSMTTLERNVFITGTRLETVVPSIDAPPAKEGTAFGRVSRDRGIARLTFHRFGVAYTLEVECAAPRTDPKCTSDEYILSLAQALAVAGGAR